MDKNNSKNSWLLDLTSLLAVVLPVAQISFVYLPDGLKSIFIQRQSFLGISLLTLFMSYISIVAYKARPWFIFVFPFHKKKMDEYNVWQQKIYQSANVTKTFDDSQTSLDKISKFLKDLEAKPVKRPFQINSENRIGIFLCLLFASALVFLILGLTNSKGALATIQSLSYFFMIILAVLILIIYRDTTNNNRRYNDDLRFSTSRAIELAIQGNCFSPRPQIKFISTHGGDIINNNYVRVEFENEQYEICTNTDSTKLVYCFKLDQKSKI